MSSDGLSNYAKTGKCRVCRRVRKTDTQVMPVGEVRHGYATGHIWECVDVVNCEKAAHEKLKDKTRHGNELIEFALSQGRWKEYRYYS